MYDSTDSNCHDRKSVVLEWPTAAAPENKSSAAWNVAGRISSPETEREEARRGAAMPVQRVSPKSQKGQEANPGCFCYKMAIIGDVSTNGGKGSRLDS
jgi:hypothetical protein